MINRWEEFRWWKKCGQRFLLFYSIRLCRFFQLQIRMGCTTAQKNIELKKVHFIRRKRIVTLQMQYWITVDYHSAFLCELFCERTFRSFQISIECRCFIDILILSFLFSRKSRALKINLQHFGPDNFQNIFSFKFISNLSNRFFSFNLIFSKKSFLPIFPTNYIICDSR